MSTSDIYFFIIIFFERESNLFDLFYQSIYIVLDLGRGHRGRDRMVVGFSTTYAISAYHTEVVSLNPVHGEVYSDTNDVIKFVSNLR